MSPKARQILYVVGVVTFALLTVLSTTKVIDTQTAASVSAALTAVLGLFGVTGFGVAAYNTNKQINNGAFEEQSPADQVVNGLNAVINQAHQAQAEVDRVKDAVVTAVNDVPVIGTTLGPLAQQAIDKLIAELR